VREAFLPKKSINQKSVEKICNQVSRGNKEHKRLQLQIKRRLIQSRLKVSYYLIDFDTVVLKKLPIQPSTPASKGILSSGIIIPNNANPSTIYLPISNLAIHPQKYASQK
jgi:hypothetical protein